MFKRSLGASYFRLDSILIYVCYLIVLGMIALVLPGGPSEPDAWNMTISRLIEKGVGWSDPTSFATAARDIFETGWIRVGNDWIFNLWPPGLPIIEAAVLVVFGRDAPLLLILQIIAVILHATVAFSFYATLRRYLNGVASFFIAVLPYTFPVTRLYLLQPTGVAFGETFAAGFFFLGMLASIIAIRENSYLHAVVAGVALSLSAYVRSQFEIILTIQAIVAAVLLLVTLTLALRRNNGDPVPVTKLICLIVIVASTQVGLLPWRIHNLVQDGTIQWVSTSALTARNSVMSDADLIAIGGNFVIQGGGNVACKIASQTCGNLDNAQVLFYQTFFQNPAEWISFKVKLIPKYWFAPMGSWVTVQSEPDLSDIIYNSVLALLSAAALLMIFSLRSLRENNAWFAIVVFNLTLLITYGAVIVFVQFEARYLYFPKVAGTMLFLIEIAIMASSSSIKSRTTRNSQIGA